MMTALPKASCQVWARGGRRDVGFRLFAAGSPERVQSVHRFCERAEALSLSVPLSLSLFTRRPAEAMLAVTYTRNGEARRGEARPKQLFRA